MAAREKKLDEFLKYLNNLHPKIKFTMEVEASGKLPFLDVLIIRKPDGTLGYTVYRKPTHTNRYLNAFSHHHPAQLQSVINTLICRSKRLSDDEHREEEMNNIRDGLLGNGFAESSIKKAIQRQENGPTVTEQQTPPISKVILPYIKGTTEKIKRILSKVNIETIFTTDKKIGEILHNPKDKIRLEHQGVYEVPCGECEKTYIGQTNRRINVRNEEHKNAVKKKELTSSLTQHFLSSGHTIDFDNTKSLARVEYLQDRITREAIEIEKRPHSLNKRDDGQRLPNTWKPVINNRRITVTSMAPPASIVRPMRAAESVTANSNGSNGTTAGGKTTNVTYIRTNTVRHISHLQAAVQPRRSARLQSRRR